MAERDLLEYLNTEDNQNPSNSQGRDLLSYIQESTETAPQEDLGVSTVGANLYDYDPSQYDYGGIQVSELGNLEGIRAENQGVLDALGRSTANLIGKTGINVVGGTIGTIYGLGSAIASGEVSDIWDNSLTTSLDAASEAVGDTFKVYKSADYEDRTLLGRLVLHPIQFTDEFMDTLSFTTGAIVTEMLTSGMASGLVGARALKYLKGLDKAADASEVASSMSNITNRIGRGLGNAGTLTRQLATGAAWEASVEARHGAIEMRDNMTAQLMEQYGVDSVEQLPQEELDAIDDAVSNAGLFTFLTNMALVGGSNLIQFPKLFGQGYNTSKRAIDKARIGLEDNLYKDIGLPTTKAGRRLRNIKATLKNPFYEGVVEEGGQGVIGETAANYWDIKNDDDSKSEVNRFLESFGTALKDTYTTGEGWYEIGMGMLIGALGAPGRGLIPGNRGINPETGQRYELWQGGAIEGLQQMRQEDAEIATLVNELNNTNAFDALKANYDFLVESGYFNKQMDRAISKNDIFAFENYRDDAIHSYTKSRIKAGLTDDINTQIEQLNQIPVDDFYLSFRGEDRFNNSTPEARERFKQESIKEFKDKAYNTIEAYNIVDDAYTGNNEDLRDELAYNVASAKNIDVREYSINQSLSDLTNGYISNLNLREETDTNLSDIESNLKEQLKDKELSKEDKVNIQSELDNINKIKEVKGYKDLTDVEVNALNRFISNSPVEARLNLSKVINLLNDSKKLRRRRQSFIELYNTLFTKEGQEKFEQYQRDLIEAENKAIADEEAKEAKESENKEVKKRQKEIKKKSDNIKKEKKPVDNKPMTDEEIAALEAELNELDDNFVPPTESSQPISTTSPETTKDSNTEAKIADIERRRQEELGGGIIKGNELQNIIKKALSKLNTKEGIIPLWQIIGHVDKGGNVVYPGVGNFKGAIDYNEVIKEIYNIYPEHEADKIVERLDNEIEDSGRKYEVDEINAKYDAELAALESNTLSPEEKTVVKILDSEEQTEVNKEINTDGYVTNDIRLDKNTSWMYIDRNFDNSYKRNVGNTITSLNIHYNEDIGLNTQFNKIYRIIKDEVDEEGNPVINENFDSRLQDPNQFGKGQSVKMVVPTYSQMMEAGMRDDYTQEEYNQELTNIEKIPVAFLDSNNKIIGYLPTTDNVRNRVQEEFRDTEVIKNQKLRTFVLNNRNTEFNVTITAKSSGAPMFVQNNDSIYNRLGNGERLAEGVHIGVYKNNKLMNGLNSVVPAAIKLPDDITVDEYFKEGVVYTIIPTADGETSFAFPADIAPVGSQQAETILRMVQLFRANPKFPRDKALITERDNLSSEIDFSNTQQVMSAIENIIYVNNNSSNNMFQIDTKNGKLRLGITTDKVFDLNDVMNNTDVQNKVIYEIAGRFPTIRLANFGQRFNTYELVDGVLQQRRYRNYFDYLNDKSIITTNIQGQPIEGTDRMYFTAQSVIEFSDPVITEESKTRDIPTTSSRPTDQNGDPISRTGARLKPKRKTKPDIQDDYDLLNNIDEPTLDQQAENLMRICKS